MNELTIAAMLRRAVQCSPDREIVSRNADGSLHRTTWAGIDARSRRLASALLGLGLSPGARVATLCVSHHRHLELYFAAPLAGLVLHPLNHRLHDDDIAYIATHAGDEVLVVDEAFLPLVERIRDRTPLRHVVVVAENPDPADGYEGFLAGGDPAWQPGDLDEHAVALVAFTSGTTGRPKGVEVTHRAIALHALSTSLPGYLGMRDTDVVLPVVPMFHALAWGWPYTAALLGATLVLPGNRLDPAGLLELIDGERVTLTGGVPTVWLGVLRTLDADPGAFDVSSLRMVLSGGSTAPPAMIDGFARRHGVPLVHTWGMTELLMGAVAELSADLLDADAEEQHRYRLTQGRPMPLTEIQARTDAGGLAPWDGHTPGELEIRGPWVAGSYLDAPEASAERWTGDGWFRTGDIVTIAPGGYLEITDRAKDVVKSGGEWISTPALESALMAHPAVAEAAVIGVADDRWGERPLAVVAAHCGSVVTAAELREFLGGRVARFWIPERVEFVASVPKTAVGKFDKVALRRDHVVGDGAGTHGAGT
ncbi:long-chain-fatty-acid--CoA ligase [Pseudonocardia nematodicida]|uniref:Long-chain-fatty-acid--CoA ligase n=1 Tax=Pseudonocardia nematodicida TaxID=1206997 RepID=A0ABV1KHN2_9PSEU